MTPSPGQTNRSQAPELVSSSAFMNTASLGTKQGTRERGRDRGTRDRERAPSPAETQDPGSGAERTGSAFLQRTKQGAAVLVLSDINSLDAYEESVGIVVKNELPKRKTRRFEEKEIHGTLENILGSLLIKEAIKEPTRCHVHLPTWHGPARCVAPSATEEAGGRETSKPGGQRGQKPHAYKHTSCPPDRLFRGQDPPRHVPYDKRWNKANAQ